MDDPNPAESHAEPVASVHADTSPQESGSLLGLIPPVSSMVSTTKSATLSPSPPLFGDDEPT